MIPFKQYCEEFIQYDSQITTNGNGPSVTGAKNNGIMSKPKPVSTAIIGDNSGFSGNNVVMSRNIDTPFELRVKQSGEMYTIFIKYKGDNSFIPLKQTKFSDKMSCEFDNKQEAVAAARDLKFKISQIDFSKK
jgi:hypothetical protein